MQMNRPEKGQTGGESYFRSPNVSASDLTMYLKGVDFPADKQKIIDSAKSHGAPENVIQFLNRLPDKEYVRVTELESEFNKMK